MRGLRLSITLSLFCICAKAQVPKEKTLLWEVSGKGLTQPSYLFGTIHLICPEDLKVPAVVKAKFDACKQLYLELDLDDPKIMMQVMQASVMKDTNTIKGLLGAARFDSTDRIFRSKTGFSLTMMNKAKPILLMSLLYPSMLGCTPESWEKVFEKMASSNKMELKGLENLSAQLEVFEKIPYKVQAEMFSKMIMNMDSAQKSFQRMLDYYKSGNIEAMSQMASADEDFGDYEKLLLNDRNKKWIPVITEQAMKVSTFFAFGAGHLGGESGVISLLRKAGFTVKPISY